ncbi:efflux RND transporter periplasmic adaptor subunit [Lutibacter holmesii]|uniref:Efflux RND transporter periplasmic adaptor subunit n=1 Tax=Lutibacter holmesii TaxID=1137985 RepID=A0ABW3WKW9_9FLAO
MKFKSYIIITLTIVFSLSSCKEKVKEPEVVLRSVKYQIVGTSSAQNIRTFSGIAKAGDEIELSFRSNGIITKLDAKVGQKVKKGDLISKLDNVQAKLAYEQAVSSVNTNKSAMIAAKSNLERVKSMYENDSNSLSDYENAKNSYQSAYESYISSIRNRDIQQSQINYGYIKAPTDGVIAAKNKELNENVSAGEVIVVLNAGESINVVVGLPENVINKVNSEKETKLSFSAIENVSFKGHVIEVSPILDANSATYPVKIEVDKPSSKIKPGMATSITFDFSTASVVENVNSLVVPLSAVGEDKNGNFVFKIESTDNKIGKVIKQTIEVGKLDPSGIIVKEGLKKGDKIATAGLQTLLDGQKVSLLNN